jgi:hypothetical protein
LTAGFALCILESQLQDRKKNIQEKTTGRRAEANARGRFVLASGYAD